MKLAATVPALLLATVFLAASAAARPVRSFRPAGAKLALDLPAGWHTTTPGKGWRFEAIGPGYSGWVFLSVVRAVVANGAFQRSLVAFERRQAAKLGPHPIIRTKRTIIGGEQAVVIYSARRGTNAQYVYGFQHAGLEYVLVYATTSENLAAVRPDFAASADSVRFLAG